MSEPNESRRGGHAPSRDEADWRVFRELRPLLLDRLCRRILADCQRVIAGDASAHERYLQLFELIQRRDDDIAAGFNDVRRSNLVMRMLAVYRLGLFEPDELDRFSDQLQQTLQMLSRPRR